jgi:hypothetical protein
MSVEDPNPSDPIENKGDKGDNPENGNNGADSGNAANNVEVGTTETAGADLVGDMPPVSDQGMEPPKKKYDGLKDRKGRAFDPNLHDVDENGDPILTTKGTLKMLKAGRPKKNIQSKLNTESSAPKVATSSGLVDQNNYNDARPAGVTSAHMLMTGGVMLFGDEWRPVIDEKKGIDERANLEDAFTEYYASRGVKDMPASAVLITAILGYALPRFSKPKTQEKAKGWWAKYKLWREKKRLEKEYGELQQKEKAPEPENEEAQ